MSDPKIAKMVFNKWRAELAKKAPMERTIMKADANLEDLFYQMSTYGVEFDEAQDYVMEAAAAHMPSYMVAENVFKKIKASTPGLNKAEFIASWKHEMEEKANAAFHTFYQIPGAEAKVEDTGSMSAKEYALQRQHADSYKELTKEELDELEAKRQRFLEEDVDDLTVDL
jgi:hypothetical protein